MISVMLDAPGAAGHQTVDRMPTVRRITELLTEAGFAKSAVVRAQAGREARNIPGFLVTGGKAADRRTAYVYHIGRGAKSRLQAYGRVLANGDLVVTPIRNGLKIASKRTITQRGRG